jgi:hypothetical protein
MTEAMSKTDAMTEAMSKTDAMTEAMSKTDAMTEAMSKKSKKSKNSEKGSDFDITVNVTSAKNSGDSRNVNKREMIRPAQPIDEALTQYISPEGIPNAPQFEKRGILKNIPVQPPKHQPTLPLPTVKEKKPPKRPPKKVREMEKYKVIKVENFSCSLDQNYLLNLFCQYGWVVSIKISDE